MKSTGQRLQGNYQISGDNFSHLEVLGQNSGNSTSIVNGSISQSITLTYYLKSTKTGVFKIPGIEFLLNGKQYPCQDKTIKIVKQRKDSAQIYNEQNRKDLEKDEIEQLKYLELYLPKQLSDDEVEQIINKIIDDCGASSMKDMGMVMGLSSKQLGGKADGKKIAEIVRKKLQ